MASTGLLPAASSLGTPVGIDLVLRILGGEALEKEINKNAIGVSRLYINHMGVFVDLLLKGVGIYIYIYTMNWRSTIGIV